MARAARDFRVCWGRHLLPALPDFGHGRPSSLLDDTWRPPIITEHFSTISSGCGGACADLATACASALARQPPGALPAALGASSRLGRRAEDSARQRDQFLKRGARGGESIGRTRRPRSCRARSRLMGHVWAVSQAQEPPTGPTRAIDRRAEHQLPSRTHQCHLRPQRATTAPTTAASCIQHDQLRARLGSQGEPFQGVQGHFANFSNNGSKKASDL